MTSRLAAALFAVGLLLAAPTAACAVTLGMADDPTLVRSGAPDGLLDVGQGHGVEVVRVIASPDRDREPYMALARNLAARGMTLHATLDQPFGDRGEDLHPQAFAAWAAGMAADLQATGVDLRVGLLNEPDLMMSAAGECTPDAVARVVKSSTASSSTRTTTQRVKVRKMRTVLRALRRHGRVVRRLGRAVMVKVQVPVSRRTKVRTRVWGRVVTRWTVLPVYRYVVRATSTTVAGEPIERSDTVTELSPRRECFAIIRARHAAEVLREAIPAVRAAAPAVPVIIGETSPATGVSTFIGELAAQGLPAADGWADHPYGLAQATTTARLVRAGFGVMPMDWTEFGSPRADGDEHAAEFWRGAGRLACSMGVRSLVAYQWVSEPGAGWDTSLLDSGLGETARAAAFAGIAC